MDQIPTATRDEDFQSLVSKIAIEEANLAYPGVPTVARKGYVAHVAGLGNVVAPPDATRQFLSEVTVARR
jgi:hypothetical protein